MKKKYTKSKQAVQAEPKPTSSANSNAITIWTNYIKYTTMASETHATIMALQTVRSIGKEVYNAYATLNIYTQTVYLLLAVLFICAKDYIDTYVDQYFVAKTLFCLLAASLIFWIIRFISVILYKKFTSCCDSHIASCKETYEDISKEFTKANS